MLGCDESSGDYLPIVFTNKPKMDSQEHISTGSSYMISIKETSAERVLNKIIVHYIVIIQ